MAKTVRSARGLAVDFDTLRIKQQLAAHPVSVSANQRRKFIDEKDGVKHRENYIVSGAVEQNKVPDALALSVSAADESAKASSKKPD